MVWMSGVEPRPIRCQETSGLFWHNFRPEKRKAGNDDDGGGYEASCVTYRSHLKCLQVVN